MPSTASSKEVIKDRKKHDTVCHRPGQTKRRSQCSYGGPGKPEALLQPPEAKNRRQRPGGGRQRQKKGREEAERGGGHEGWELRSWSVRLKFVCPSASFSLDPSGLISPGDLGYFSSICHLGWGCKICSGPRHIHLSLLPTAWSLE